MEDRKYSILIVCLMGIPSHTVRFIRNLKQTNPPVSISLYSDKDKADFPEDLSSYITEFIQQKKYSGWPHRLWIFRRLFDNVVLVKQFKKISKSRHFDIINIHYPQYYLCYVMKYMKRMSDAIVVSPWGSDVLRVSDSCEKKKLTSVFKNADYITVHPKGIFGDVVHRGMKIEKEKFHPLAWGSETIDYINEHISQVSTEQAKQLLGLGGKYVITCGYNAFKEQRHEIMIHAINDKRAELPENMILLFPLTYGSSYYNTKQEYVNHLKKLCAELNLPVVFYEDYMPVSDLFLLRQATDLFIHIQTTDGGNSSLQEYVLCGKKVIHGSWIHYVALEYYKPLFYFPVNNLDELGEVIVNAYRSEPIQIPEQVMGMIRNRGWRTKIKLWDDFFVSCKK